MMGYGTKTVIFTKFGNINAPWAYLFHNYYKIFRVRGSFHNSLAVSRPEGETSSADHREISHGRAFDVENTPQVHSHAKFPSVLFSEWGGQVSPNYSKSSQISPFLPSKGDTMHRSG